MFVQFSNPVSHYFIKTWFGIERNPYTMSRIDQIPCVCVCKYSSQTTEQKIYQQIERLTLIAIGYLDLKYLPPPYLKTPKALKKGR